MLQCHAMARPHLVQAEQLHCMLDVHVFKPLRMNPVTSFSMPCRCGLLVGSEERLQI